MVEEYPNSITVTDTAKNIRPPSREVAEKSKRQDAMNLICGYFEKEEPVAEKVKAVCAEKKMERRQLVRERQEEKRRRQAELRKSKVEKKKALEIAEEEERQKEEEGQRQHKLAEARGYLKQAKEQQQKARSEAKKQWQKDHAREQEVLKQAFIRAQRKQLAKDKEKFGARPITAGGSVVAEAEAALQHEKAAEWWQGGETGRRAQSAPTKDGKLPLSSADSDHGSDGEHDPAGLDGIMYSDNGIDQKEVHCVQQMQTLNGLQVQVQVQGSLADTQPQQQQQQQLLRSPSRPTIPVPSAQTPRSQSQTPRGTVGSRPSTGGSNCSFSQDPSRPGSPSSRPGSGARPPPRGTRATLHQQAVSGSAHSSLAKQQIEAVLGNMNCSTPPANSSSSSSKSSGLDRPTSAGRRMVAAHTTQMQKHAAEVADGLLSQSYPGPPQSVANGGPPFDGPPMMNQQCKAGPPSDAPPPASRPGAGPSMGLVGAASDSSDSTANSINRSEALVEKTAAVAEAKAQAEKQAQLQAQAQQQALTEAQQRAQALEQQVQQLLAAAAQQQSQAQMQQAFAQREQAMAAQIQDLKNKLKETVEL